MLLSGGWDNMQYNNVHRQFNLSIHFEYEKNKKKTAAIGWLSTETEHLQYTVCFSCNKSFFGYQNNYFAKYFLIPASSVERFAAFLCQI